VFHSLRRAFIHTSTFSENSLAMRAGIATMHVLHMLKRQDSFTTSIISRSTPEIAKNGRNRRTHNIAKKPKGGFRLQLIYDLEDQKTMNAALVNAIQALLQLIRDSPRQFSKHSFSMYVRTVST
jgi:hypothetical protein